MVRVGALYHPNKTNWGDDDRQEWCFSPDGVELLLVYPNVSRHEIREVNQGQAQFALLAGDHALMMAHRFGELPWSDAPWQAVRQQQRTSVGLPIAVVVITVLVEANTGVVRACRATTWDSVFTAAVRAAIRAQVHNRSTDADGLQEITMWQALYRTSDELVDAADIRWKGQPRCSDVN
jgi:hypothetical protein